MIIKRIKALLHPEEFQGWGREKKYFEGWYYKVADKNGENVFAIIPGIAFDKKGEGHSFIQFLNGNANNSHYYKFSIKDFSVQSGKFNVSIKENKFTLYCLNLNLPNVKGVIYLKEHKLWPSKWYSPGIMGPFSFIPFMECSHAIISLYNKTYGEIIIDDKKINFDQGKGYIEKDWGSSFPDGYIWMQANHFYTPKVSFVFSIANIPFLGGHFIGFISTLYFNEKFLNFSTYNGSSVYMLSIDNKEVAVGISNKKYRVEVRVERKNSGKLIAPKEGLMRENINEALLCDMKITIIEKNNNKIIFNESSRIASLEVVGKVDNLLKIINKNSK